MGEPNKYQGSFKWRRRLAILIVIGTIAGLIVQFSRFSLGYVDGGLLFQMLIYSAASFLVALFIYKLPEPRHNLNRAMAFTKISFIVGGALFGSIVTFFAAGFLL